MTERINGQGFRPADAAGTRRTDAAKPKSAESSTGPSASSTAQTGETVNLTRSGLLLNKLEEIVRDLPVVDSEKVQAIKQAVSSGSYEIDDQKVADNMIRFDRELVA